MKKVDNITPEIGKYYLVPCIEVNYRFPYADGGAFIPVLGRLHEDAEILRFPYQHWHFDMRFLQNNIFNRIVHNRKGFYALPLHRFLWVTHQKKQQVKSLQPAYRRMKCKREYPLPFPGPDWSLPLQNKYEGKKLIEGKYCPHKKANLSGIKAKDGEITCPLHGLRICAKTKSVINKASGIV